MSGRAERRGGRLHVTETALVKGVYFDDPDGHILEVITRPEPTGG